MPKWIFFIFFIFFCNSAYSLYPEHWIIQEPVYVLHLITCHGRIMPCLAELLLLALYSFVLFDSVYTVRSVSRIPFRTFWWYLVEMQNRTRQHVTYKNDNSVFLSFGLAPFDFFTEDYPFRILRESRDSLAKSCRIFRWVSLGQKFFSCRNKNVSISFGWK